MHNLYNYYTTIHQHANNVNISNQHINNNIYYNTGGWSWLRFKKGCQETIL